MSEKKIVLISFLGTGRYEKVGYKWSGKKDIDIRTEFVPLALCKFLQQEGQSIENVVILATEQAELTHGTELRQALQENNLKFDFVPYPVGSSKEEIQEQFNILVKHLNCGDFEVALDITHGFRSMPFFAAAATVFVSMVHQKKPQYIFYGAFQANGKESEIWELNNFTDLIDWSHALTLFLQTGNVGKVVEKAEPLSRQFSRIWAEDGKKGERPMLHKLSSSLQRFGDSLATVRTGDLLLGPAENKQSAAEELLEQVQSLKPQVESYMPPIAACLTKIEEMAKSLQTKTLFGKEGFDVVLSLAELYYGLGRYAECAATLREGFINLLANSDEADAVIPGFKNMSNDKRGVLDKRYGLLSNKIAELGILSSLGEVRNDIQHAGYRKNSLPPVTIKESLRKILDSFKGGEVIEHLKNHLSEKKSFEDTVFLNISNHPLSEWSEKQKIAAMDFAAHISELPFPVVPPDMSTEEIEKTADDLLKKLPENTTHAMVMGEFVLTHILVKKLQRQGIVCLAATTERRTTENAGVKTSVFDFVTFRPYPT